MAEHFKFYSATDSVVPASARYSFPTEANKTTKLTPRIPPKNGSTFSVNTSPYIRIEFPAQGYLNTTNTVLEFDLEITLPSTLAAGSKGWMNNNIASIFRRARLLYGGTPLEDILEYGLLQRSLTEWTGTNQQGTMDQNSIAQGIGGVTDGSTHLGMPQLTHVRRGYIQGFDLSVKDGAILGKAAVPNSTNTTTLTAGNILTAMAGKKIVRRYCIPLGFGLFVQNKHLPLKFMAAQLAIELELAKPSDCMMHMFPSAGAEPSYTLTNVNLLPEILEFSASYDQAILEGLRNEGVPIRFGTWHTYNFATNSSQILNLQIQERSRSTKAIFAVQHQTAPGWDEDGGATVAASNGVLENFQFRIGGRYFPAAPVTCAIDVGGNKTPQGAESYLELQKALHVVGDNRLSSSINALRWCPAAAGGHQNEQDFIHDVTNTNPTGTYVYWAKTLVDQPEAGNYGSACFAMAIDLEASSGNEISGLNAMEQSDIALMARYSAPQLNTYGMTIFTYVDQIMILREDNVVEIIQ